ADLGETHRAGATCPDRAPPQPPPPAPVPPRTVPVRPARSPAPAGGRRRGCGAACHAVRAARGADAGREADTPGAAGSAAPWPRGVPPRALAGPSPRYIGAFPEGRPPGAPPPASRFRRPSPWSLPSRGAGHPLPPDPCAHSSARVAIAWAPHLV